MATQDTELSGFRSLASAVLLLAVIDAFSTSKAVVGDPLSARPAIRERYRMEAISFLLSETAAWYAEIAGFNQETFRKKVCELINDRAALEMRGRTVKFTRMASPMKEVYVY